MKCAFHRPSPSHPCRVLRGYVFVGRIRLDTRTQAPTRAYKEYAAKYAASPSALASMSSNTQCQPLRTGKPKKIIFGVVIRDGSKGDGGVAPPGAAGG